MKTSGFCCETKFGLLVFLGHPNDKYCFSYGLSYLQSVFLVDLTTRAPCEGEAAIDPASLSSIDLVNLARHSLDRGCVDIALS